MSNVFSSYNFNSEQVQGGVSMGGETLAAAMLNIFTTVRALVASGTSDMADRSVSITVRQPDALALWLPPSNDQNGVSAAVHEHFDEITRLVHNPEGLATTDDFLNPDRLEVTIKNVSRMELYAAITLVNEEVDTKTVFYFFYNAVHRCVCVYSVSYGHITAKHDDVPVVHGVKSFLINEITANAFNTIQRNEKLINWFHQYSGL